jgi:hypothetical protein
MWVKTFDFRLETTDGKVASFGIGATTSSENNDCERARAWSTDGLPGELPGLIGFSMKACPLEQCR